MSPVPPKRVAIVQSCYVPWRGYFDLINLVDEFILFDDRQFTRRDWRNRNRVKTAQGVRWLTVPVVTKGRYRQRIDETLTDGDEWRQRHWETLRHAYGAAPFFDTYRRLLEELYLASDERRLSAMNRRFIEAICEILGVATRITWSTDYEAEGERSERLASLCVAAGATSYLSGPRGRAYLDEGVFSGRAIALDYMDYSGYPEYEQLHPPFDGAVSILDLLFSTGPDAPKYMKSFSPAAAAA